MALQEWIDRIQIVVFYLFMENEMSNKLQEMTLQKIL